MHRNSHRGSGNITKLVMVMVGFLLVMPSWLNANPEISHSSKENKNII